MEKINYPVKYVLLGIYEQVGHNYFGWADPIYDVCGYIVSKAYLVGETVEYKGNGNSEKNYQVVFPFVHPALNGLSRREFPHKDASGRYSDVVSVTEVFEDFEEGKKKAEEQNKQIKTRNLVKNISFSDSDWQKKYQEIEEEFARKMQKYSEYEQTILDRTEDMVVLKTSSLEALIAKITNSQNLFYQAIGEALSPEERIYIMSKIQRTCSTCANTSCRVENYEKPIENCIGWLNHEVIGRNKVLGQYKL